MTPLSFGTHRDTSSNTVVVSKRTAATHLCTGQLTSLRTIQSINDVSAVKDYLIVVFSDHAIAEFVSIRE